MVTEVVMFENSLHESLLPMIVDMHIDCIMQDDCLIRYRPPFTPEKRENMLQFWKSQALQVEQGKLVMIMSVATDSNGCTTPTGIVQLRLPLSECGLFRADVEMLMVSHKHRGLGLARVLMVELERIARSKGCTLLVCIQLVFMTLTQLKWW